MVNSVTKDKSFALLPEAEVLGVVAIVADWVSDIAVGASAVLFTVSQKSEGNASQYKYSSAYKRNLVPFKRDSNSLRDILSSSFLSNKGK